MESPLIVNGRIATDTEGAREFLGLVGEHHDWRWAQEKGSIKKLGNGWYSYRALADYVETKEKRPEQEGLLRSESPRPRNGQDKKLVFPDFSGGRGKASAGSRG